MSKIKYRKGYKYQLYNDYSIATGIKRPSDVATSFLFLSRGGILTISKGYAWDGPSGPTFDTKNFMRGSLVHDALYQLMREGLLPQGYREKADRLLREICLDAGMSKLRAWYVYRGVSRFAFPFARPELRIPIQEAP